MTQNTTARIVLLQVEKGEMFRKAGDAGELVLGSHVVTRLFGQASSVGFKYTTSDLGTQVPLKIINQSLHTHRLDWAFTWDSA